MKSCLIFSLMVLAQIGFSSELYSRSKLPEGSPFKLEGINQYDVERFKGEIEFEAKFIIWWTWLDGKPDYIKMEVTPSNEIRNSLPSFGEWVKVIFISEPEKVLRMLAPKKKFELFIKKRDSTNIWRW